MSLEIQLLGPPVIVSESRDVYRFRSRKTWALLAYLLLTERPPSRSQIASLLFDQAEDPLGAVRWSLSEIRKALDIDGVVEGDPVVLQLASHVTVDVRTVTSGVWPQAATLSLGSELLEGLYVQASPAFDTWLLSQRHHLAAQSEAIAHEAAVGMMSRGDLSAALDLAATASALNPFDENHQALVIKLYRLSGDLEGAQRQFDSYAKLCREELGTEPGPAARSALRERPAAPVDELDRTALDAIVESGMAAIAAGATEAGVSSLRSAVALADRLADVEVRLSTRLGLAEALIHSYGGYDEEGISVLHQAAELAERHEEPRALAQARSELGYVDFLRGRYGRARHWLTMAVGSADEDSRIVSKAYGYLGAVENDQANYSRARELLAESVELARRVEDRRRESYVRSMIGRFNLLIGNLDAAEDELQRSIALAETEH